MIHPGEEQIEPDEDSAGDEYPEGEGDSGHYNLCEECD